jgi:type VI secretion system protein ImpK
MMQPGERKVLTKPIASPQRTAFGQGRGLDWADGAVQTLFGQNGASAGQTLFGTKAAAKEGPSLVTLGTDLLLIGVKIMETPHLGDANALRKLLLAYFKDFERTCLSHGKSPDAIEEGKYALAAFIDETIVNTPNNCREEWIREPLQAQFFNDHSAGEHFFTRLEGLIGDMRRNLEALEVFYLCLGLGFQGRYRVEGQELLPNVVRNLLRRIEAVKGKPPQSLSPSAYVQPGLGKSGRGGKPFVIGAAIFLLLAIALFFVLQFASDSPLDLVQKSVERILGGENP